MNPMKPILFNTDMVRANLEDRKNATRRIADINTEITCNDGTTNHDFVLDNFTGGTATGFVCRKCGFGVAPPHSRVPCGSSLFRPRYWPGDILYVRETWRVKNCVGDYSKGTKVAEIEYAAGGKTMIISPTDPAFDKWRTGAKWHPSIHMPKEAARLFLRVTRVRVERLQDIDGEQAYREGATAKVPRILEEIETYGTPKFPKNFYKFSDTKKEDWCRGTATAIYIARCELAQRLIRSFKKIWDATIKKEDLDTYGWDANPWVWVIEYERISKEEAMKC